MSRVLNLSRGFFIVSNVTEGSTFINVNSLSYEKGGNGSRAC